MTHKTFLKGGGAKYSTPITNTHHGTMSDYQRKFKILVKQNYCLRRIQNFLHQIHGVCVCNKHTTTTNFNKVLESVQHN